MSKVWYLKQVNIFKGLSDDDLNRLASNVREKTFGRKEIIFFPEDPGDRVYFIKTGLVKLAKISPAGKEMTIAILEPGEIFGDLDIINESRRDTLAQAIIDTQVITVSKREFEKFVHSTPDLCGRISRKMAKRVRELEEQIEDIVFKDVPGRLASLIFRLLAKYSKDHTKGRQVDIRLTHQEIANLIGATRETTSLNLSRLKQEGLITFDDHKVIVLDEERLNRLRTET